MAFTVWQIFVKLVGYRGNSYRQNILELNLPRTHDKSNAHFQWHKTVVHVTDLCRDTCIVKNAFQATSVKTVVTTNIAGSNFLNISKIIIWLRVFDDEY